MINPFAIRTALCRQQQLEIKSRRSTRNMPCKKRHRTEMEKKKTITAFAAASLPPPVDIVVHVRQFAPFADPGATSANRTEREEKAMFR
jgi:hypothetical protein